MATTFENCPVRQVLAAVTGKWEILILHTLSEGPARFGELKRSLENVSQRVLTEKLRSLERDGYLNRHVDPGPPISSTYKLTDRGQAMFELLAPLVAWAANNHTDIQASRAEYDQD